MIRSRALGALLCALLLFAPTACDDPTSVGGELIGEQNAGPKRVELVLDSLKTVRYAPVTGTAAAANLSASRFLAGQTTDDPLGDVEATAYVDFARVSAPEDIASRTLASVELQLQPNYFYGDTTQTPTYALYDLEEEWEEAAGASADTSLAGIVEASQITTFEVHPSDTLVTVTLPAQWVQEHASALKSATDSAFADAFHGFQLRAADGSAVTGFSSSQTSIRASFDQGEAQYTLARQLTTIRQPNPEAVEGRYVIQDGTGRALSFRFNLPDSLEGVAVNSAALVLDVDSTLAATPSGFVRPRLDTLNLYDATDTLAARPRLLPINGSPAMLTLMEEAGRFENASPLIDVVQSALLGTLNVERFQVRPGVELLQTRVGGVPLAVPSLNSVLIRRDPAPRLVLTYTSTAE